MILFDVSQFYLDGISAISPDGKAVAVAVRSVLVADVENVPNDGVWLIDLEDENVAPQHLGSTVGLQTALPEWYAAVAAATGLTWTADNAAVVTVASAIETNLHMNVLYYAPVDGGENHRRRRFQRKRLPREFLHAAGPSGLVCVRTRRQRYRSPLAVTTCCFMAM